jgi:paraquat-inducible protein B
VGGGLDKLQEQLSGILGKVEKIPLDSIGDHLNDDLAELDKALKQVNGEMLPEATVTLSEARQTFGRAGDALAEDSPLQQHLGQVLQELELTARSLRALTDLLGRHPEALIRGRRVDCAPIQTPPPSQIKDLQEPPR